MTATAIFDALMHKLNTQQGLTTLLVVSVIAAFLLSCTLYWLLLLMEKQIALAHYEDLDEGHRGVKGELELEIVELGSNKLSDHLGDDEMNIYSSVSGDGGGGPDRDISVSQYDSTASDSNNNGSPTSVGSQAANRLKKLGKKMSSCTSSANDNNDCGSSSSHHRHGESTTMRLSTCRKILLAFLTLVLVCMTNLLLVYSSAPKFVAILGFMLIAVVILHSQIIEELFSRKRIDRLSGVVTIILLLATCLNLAMYSIQQIPIEDLYQGPARIVGYDTSKYSNWVSNTEDVTSKRADLQVEWGSTWGCPNHPDKQCRADVKGAMCERDQDTFSDDAYGRDKSNYNVTEEKYYDKDGNVVDNYSDKANYYDKDGNLIEQNEDTEETKSNAKGMVQDSDTWKDTEYNNGTMTDQDSWDEDVTYDGDGHLKTWDEDDEYKTYDKDGKIKEDEVTQYDEKYQNGTNKVQEVESVDEDVKYDGSGSVTNENVSEEQEEFDDNGKLQQDYTIDMDINDKDGELSNYDIDVQDTEYEDGKIQSKTKEDSKVQYDDEDGGAKETLDTEDIVYNDKGKVKDDEEVKEDIQYDEDLDVVEDTEIEITKDKDGNVVDETVIDENGDYEEATEAPTVQRTNDGGRRLEDEEQENQELEEENEELEKENEELQEELNEYEEDLEDEEDALEDVEEEEADSYTYNDDLYDEEYWADQDWDSIWGDYSDSCYKLFDANLEHVTYNPDYAPGKDDWPFLNIYGNCQTCEAFIVDIFSTEHFQSIQSYKVAGLNYGLAAMVSLGITLFLAVKQRFAPRGEREEAFLSNGVLA